MLTSILNSTFVLAIFISNIVIAATHPLTGSSIINQPTNSIALAQMGFELNSIPKNWTYSKSTESDAKIIELGVEGKTLLSFRSESVSLKTNLEKYVRQYLRDYNQYGFDVAGLQSYKKTQTPSVIVDLRKKDKTSQSRQVFFYKQGQIIIATCADSNNDYEKTVSACNDILGSFKWRN